MGEALIDLLVAPGLSTQAQIGGAAINLARTLARLGVDVSYVGAVSTDLFGEEICASLDADGVNSERVRRCEHPTTLAIVEVTASGSPRYRFHADETSAVNVGNVEAWDWRQGDVLATGGLGLVLEPVAQATLRALEEASQDGLLTVIDVNCRVAAISDVIGYRETLRRAFRHAAIVKVSAEDLDELVALEVLIGPDRHRAMTEIHTLGPSLVILTDGSGPARVHFAGRERTVNASSSVSIDVPSQVVNPLDLVDTIGAGDAFLGGFLAWLVLHGGTDSEAFDHEPRRDLIINAVQQAHFVAAVTCCRRGADPPFAVELGDRFTR